MSKESTKEELMQKLDKARDMGLVNVVSAIQEEMLFREKVPSRERRDAIREVMSLRGIRSFSQVISNHGEEIEEIMNKK